jgi:hypothetical protein
VKKVNLPAQLRETEISPITISERKPCKQNKQTSLFASRVFLLIN